MKYCFRYYVLLVPDISLQTLYHMKEYIQKVYNLGMQSNLIYDDSELQNRMSLPHFVHTLGFSCSVALCH